MYNLDPTYLFQSLYELNDLATSRSGMFVVQRIYLFGHVYKPGLEIFWK